MALDLNADMSSLFKGVVGGKKGANKKVVTRESSIKILREPYKNITISSLTLAIVSIAFVNFIYIPQLHTAEKKAIEIARLKGLQMEMESMDVKTKALKKALAESRDHYEELLSQFSNSEDLGELYQSISGLALTYNLVVVNLKEISKPAAKPAPSQPSKTAAKVNPLDSKGVSGIKVELELKGWYTNYIKFREELAKNEELLTITSENIKVGDDKDDSSGQILVKIQLSTYALDKNPYYKVIGNNG